MTFELGFVFLTYLICSTPFGVIFCKLAKIGDIQQMGSGNIGATNVLRFGGVKLAAATLFFDFLKGAIMVILAAKFFDQATTYGAAIAAIIGHVFPIWLKFKGGKGVATSFSVIAVINFQIFALMILTWLVVFLMKRISSLASISSFIAMPIFVTFFAAEENDLFALSLIIATLVIAKHRENIVRIFRGQEKKFGKGAKLAK